jgi:hypothetical protein
VWVWDMTTGAGARARMEVGSGISALSLSGEGCDLCPCWWRLALFIAGLGKVAKTQVLFIWAMHEQYFALDEQYFVKPFILLAGFISQDSGWWREMVFIIDP